MNKELNKRSPADTEDVIKLSQTSPSTRGRDKYNIFKERDKAKGSLKPEAKSLELQALILRMRHRDWLRRFPISTNYRKAVAWSNSDPAHGRTATPLYHAERAMLLCGRRSPEKRYRSNGTPLFKPTLYTAFSAFSRFCHEVMNDTHESFAWRRRGPKPCPEKLYRTAVATLVARKFLKPKGGDRWFVPPPQAIAQVWYLIFDEVECSDAIRNRLPTIARFCETFKYSREFERSEHNQFFKLSKPLLKKYPPAGR